MKDLNPWLIVLGNMPQTHISLAGNKGEEVFIDIVSLWTELCFYKTDFNLVLV